MTHCLEQQLAGFGMSVGAEPCQGSAGIAGAWSESLAEHQVPCMGCSKQYQHRLLNNSLDVLV